ncbi:MAG: glycosyltransferase family 1 protein [Candidatus Moraniibacteriota bacterium]
MIQKRITPTIGIDAADLCHQRIDGTRIYIYNLLERFGKIAPETLFYIYLKGKINPELHFKTFPNYLLRNADYPFFWTQLKLPGLLKKEPPDVLWMPLHNMPFMRPRGIKTVITIHDLAFKLFPDLFPKRDLFLLNRLTAYSVKAADRIIAVSHSTARDLTEIFNVPPHKIRVIYHGYNSKLFHLPDAGEKIQIRNVKNKYQISRQAKYLIYVGAIQPRKNLGVLVSAFERLKTLHTFRDWKLVLAGSDAWMVEELKNQISTSIWQKDIIMTGNFSISDLPYLLWGAEIFVFPSLYEGFGIPILEAMACGVPVITARNSSLMEVSGKHAIYFEAQRVDDLATSIRELHESDKKKNEMVRGGLEWVKRFSWDETARKTYEFLIEAAIG